MSNLIPLAGLAIIFSAIGRQYKTILQKHLQFKKIALIDIAAVVIALVLAIILAVKGFGVYALVYSALTQYGIGNLVYFVLGNNKQRLIFHFNYRETKPFLKIGMYQVGGQVVNYFNRDLDVLMIGKFFGAELLGGYSLAKQLAKRPISFVAPIVIRVATSILPRYQNDNLKLNNYILKINKGSAIINSTIYGLMVILAPLVITIMYGEEYLNIQPIFIFLTICF